MCLRISSVAGLGAARRQNYTKSHTRQWGNGFVILVSEALLLAGIVRIKGTSKRRSISASFALS